MRDRTPKMLDFLGQAPQAQVIQKSGPEASGCPWNWLIYHKRERRQVVSQEPARDVAWQMPTWESPTQGDELGHGILPSY